MRVAVQLDDQETGGAVEIGDISAERLLTRELPWKGTQELEPQLALCGSRVTAQVACAVLEISLVGDKTLAGHGTETP
jgi:hypothetical protein